MKLLGVLSVVASQILSAQLVFAQPAGKPAPRPAKEQRIALVIGNGGYKESPLSNPVNDARDLAKSLEEVGFQVTRLENANLGQMVKAVRDFGDRLQQGGVGLFYFAGHGMQVRGRNFLIPVGAQIEREDEVAYQSVDANQVLEKMESARNRLNIVILDACRNNPFARAFRSTAQGLAQMDAPVGTLVAFATAPGSVASDGNGRNGLYTQHILKNLKEPGLKVEDLFKRVRLSVRQDSQGRQVPWESTSLEGDFYFLPPPAKTARPAEPRESVAFAKPSAQAPRRAERPAMTKGDEWKYVMRNLGDGSSRTFTIAVAEVTPSEVVMTNGDRYDLDGGIKVLNAEGRRHEPSLPRFIFPMTPGAQKKGSYRIVGDKKYPEWTEEYTMRVVGLEQVTVAAGTFDAFKVEVTGTYRQKRQDGQSGTGAFKVVRWYAPAVKREVLRENESATWSGAVERRTRQELTAYSVR